MRLGRGKRRPWPAVPLPDERGAITVSDVLTAAPGAERDHAIDAWCEAVWHAYRDNRHIVIDLLSEYGVA
jgi:hypothetical protein